MNDYKKMIESLRYYGTTYAIGDNLGHEIDGTDKIMMEAADAIETLVSHLNTDVQYIQHTCQTCRYWERSTNPEHTHCCTNPNRKEPCFVWNAQNWEWNGAPREKH